MAPRAQQPLAHGQLVVAEEKEQEGIGEGGQEQESLPSFPTPYARLARAFTPEDFATLFGNSMQPSLFASPIEAICTVA